MPQQIIKAGPQFRTVNFTREAINEEARTVELAFSSEEPVERYFGDEILDHSPESVNLDRLHAGGPVLVGHDSRDHVGVVESVSIDSDRRGRAVVRFGKSERATEIFNDVVDMIRTSVSVGYRIFRAVLEEEREDGPNVYRVKEWQPFEISLVSIPADITVGVGRSADETAPQNDLILETPKKEQRTMPEARVIETPAAPAVDVDAIRAAAQGSERGRISEILAVGARHNQVELANEYVRSGKPIEDFRAAVLEKMDVRKVEAEAPDLGMTDKEMDRFSVVRAINALADPTNKRAMNAAAFEFEASAAAAERMGRESRGITIPSDVLKRDLTVGVATAGGNTVATDLLAGSFIEMLRNRSLMMQLATVLSDLNGNIAIPRHTGAATGYWVAESGAPTESQQAFDQVALSPETMGAFTDISRKLLLQSSLSVEGFVRMDLARVLGLQLDLGAINGSGAGNQPTGILNQTGIGDVAGGANGAAPTWDHIVDLETAVAVDNADVGSLQYIVNAKTRGKLKKTFVDAGSGERLWDSRAGATPLNGYGAGVTNQVPSNLVKGASGAVCSGLLFGNFRDLIIGLWGGLDINVDTATGSTSGTVRVVALQDADVAVRHAQSFAAMQDALTV